MKKLFVSIFIMVFTLSVFAQENESNQTSGALVSKKGENYLPESGDWAISFDASPVFTFIGNAFNGNTYNPAPGVDWLNGNQTIIGKLFLDDKTAIRALVRIGFLSSTTKALIADATVTAPPAYPVLFPTVEDKLVSKGTFIGIGGGYEMRRGKTRLQGYYGGDVMIWARSLSDKYTYGNKISATVPVFAYTTDFGDNLVFDPFGYDGRILKETSGMTFGFGVRGFIGAEYFLFPKISVGAEYGWGLGIQRTGKSKLDVESFNGTNVGTVSSEEPGSSEFGVDTDLNQGNIFGFKGSNTGSATFRVTFHF